jgi:hypothetical protein
MSQETLTISPTIEQPEIILPPTDLIYDDGEPMESNRHRIAMNILIDSVNQALNYFVYNPFDPSSLQGWKLGNNQKYEPIEPNDQGRLWCDNLSLWLGVYPEKIKRETAPWLRFYDPEGNLILLAEEIAEIEKQKAEAERQKAEAERQKAEILAAKLRELGIDPEQLSK